MRSCPDPYETFWNGNLWNGEVRTRLTFIRRCLGPSGDWPAPWSRNGEKWRNSYVLPNVLSLRCTRKSFCKSVAVRDYVGSLKPWFSCRWDTVASRRKSASWSTICLQPSLRKSQRYIFFTNITFSEKKPSSSKYYVLYYYFLMSRN